MIGIIGGSGLYQMEGIKNLKEKKVETPFGVPSDDYVLGEIAGKEVAFLAQDRETWSLFIVDVQEKGLRRLVKDLNGATRPTWPWYRASMRGEYPENQPRWSPDGKHITYADNSRIFVVNGDGSELKELRGRAKINSHF